jgi:UDP-N-acetylglucosamine 2-epimerase (non-hydrolysing)
MNIDLGQGAVLPIDPLPYATMVLLMSKSYGVITDSGGLQKEAYILGIPCSTLRAETEWTETLVNDWNVLVGDVNGLSEVVTRGRPYRARPEFYGNGQAAHTVARTLLVERR